METPDIDGLLGVLRKHGVSEFNQDQFGLRVKFASEPPRLAGIDAWMPEAEPVEVAPKQQPIPEQENGTVEPTRHDLDDVLFGAK